MSINFRECFYVTRIYILRTTQQGMESPPAEVNHKVNKTNKKKINKTAKTTEIGAPADKLN